PGLFPLFVQSHSALRGEQGRGLCAICDHAQSCRNWDDGAALVGAQAEGEYAGVIREPTITESHNTMLNLSSCSGNYWLYVLLIVLGGVTPGLAGVVRAQAQTPPSAPQADPDNAEHVALGQQVYTSFCTG